ncbi:GTP-binding ADP-ribosylation factor ARF1, putative [Ixodes scapularis]|uniref:GTP-binding ADP-ribosylation factor ARF1, putative n=1 Tax=Ixodes scapularis TaxID=6945 RepID=B7PYJ8_IXOSC|nr:GTP-binding ADP-ribosylation factor ARF1, putative [Ixodes scapularis]|eukprot:XP_002403180.1 GTP-binding ADP-ribosylation factor ARF1, putative [Ixodes scapularis]
MIFATHFGHANVPRKVLFIGSIIAVGVTTLLALGYYWKRRSRRCYSDVDESTDSGKRILVLGLNEAGKSSFLLRLSRPDAALTSLQPTEGFNVVCINSENGSSLNFWERKQPLHDPPWRTRDPILVTTIRQNSCQKFKKKKKDGLRTRKDLKLCNVLIMLSQDLPGAESVEEIATILGLEELRRRSFSVHILPLQMPSDTNHKSSVAEAKHMIIRLSHEHASV